MLNFRWLHNNTYQKIRPNSCIRVGVYQRSGEIRYVDWLGVIERAHALNLGSKCVSVKLRMDSFAYGVETFGLEWTEIGNGKFLQGCYVPSLEGVFAVIEEGAPKVVEQKYSMAGAHSGKY